MSRERNKSEGELHGAAVLQHGTSTHSVTSGSSRGGLSGSGSNNRLLDPPRARPPHLDQSPRIPISRDRASTNYSDISRYLASPTSAASSKAPESSGSLADTADQSNLAQRLHAIEKRFEEKLERRLSTLEYRTEQRLEHLTNKSDNYERTIERTVHRIVREAMSRYQDVLPQLRDLIETPKRGAGEPESPKLRFDSDNAWHPVPPPPPKLTPKHNASEDVQGGRMEFPRETPAPSQPVSSRPVLPSYRAAPIGGSTCHQNGGWMNDRPGTSLKAESAAISEIRAGMRMELDRVQSVISEWTSKVQSNLKRIEVLEAAERTGR